MTQSLNLVFCGTPRFAVPTLEKLAEAGHRIHLVVTQPDRPKGRGLEFVASPVKQAALRLDLPITQPERIKNNEEFRAQLTSLKPDAIIVVGYGRIIPQWMLDLAPLGNLNLHASLLPKYRGAAPIQWAIASGEAVTGVTTMRIDAGLDTGDILLQRELEIASDDTAETLAPRLAAIGADLMVQTLCSLQAGTIHPRPQDNSQSSLAPILKKEDGLIDFSNSAKEILNRIRGFQPWPGVYTRFRAKTLQVLKARSAAAAVAPAELRVEGDQLLVGCGHQSSLELKEIQLEGKKRTSAADFIRGYRPKAGEKLG
ncbi:MAG TPA: methionyl-tRNA formyltransferase [Candidatus Sulfotelmatobacter sp.]|jgi:methionyl-tRNA formyltransferase|nr:methionyl-tRNA formyltransferase [Candidatus Sulfotelmatobacter sp.]